MAHTNYDKLKQAAQDMKAHQIQRCRHYIGVGKSLGYSDKSTTFRSWNRELEGWQELPIWQAMRYREAIAASGLTPSEVEEVLASQ